MGASKRNDEAHEDDIDVTEEETELAEEEASSAQKIKQLREKLKRCDEEKRTHLEELQRTRAEFLNSRKRLEEQLKRDTERITENHIYDLLPLADSFDIAMQSPGWKECDETWRKGIEGIHAQLMQVLKRNNVTAIKETGEPFDPHVHEAVTNEPVADEKDIDTVVRVLQPGYKMNDTVIRHAKVAVGAAENKS